MSVDPGVLADPGRCPGCGVRLPAFRGPWCPACRLPLTGVVAEELWRVSSQAASLLGRREVLLATLRAQVVVEAAPLRPVTETAPPQAPFRPVFQPPVAPEEVSRRGVAAFVLGTGVLLLAVAAIVFTAVTWKDTGTGGRSAVLALLLLLTVAGSVLAQRRKLPLTAEALGALSVIMSLLDAYAAWSANLGGLGGANGFVYAAGSLALLGGTAWLGSRLLPLRTLRIAAPLLLQGPLPLLAARSGAESLLPLAAALGVQATLDVALLAWARRGRVWRWDPVSRLTVLAAAVFWSGGFVFALPETASWGAVAVFSGLLVSAALAARLLRGNDALRNLTSAAATVTLLTALVAVVAVVADGADRGPEHAVWGAVAAAALAASGLLALYALPRGYRAGPAVVFGVLAIAPVATAVGAVATSMLGPVHWFGNMWDGSPDLGARRLATARGWDYTWAALLLAPAAAAVVGLVTDLFRRRLIIGRMPVPGVSWPESMPLYGPVPPPAPGPGLSRPAVVAFALLGGWAALASVPTSLDLPVVVALGWWLVLAAVCAGAALRGAPSLLWAAAGLSGVAAASGSLATESTSVAVWGLLAVLAAAVAVRSPLPYPGRVDLRKNPGWERAETVRVAASVAAFAFATAETGLVTAWAGDSPAAVAVAAAAAAGVVAFVAQLLPRPGRGTVDALTATAALVWAGALTAVLREPGPAAVVLALALPAALYGAVNSAPARRDAWAAAAVLLLGFLPVPVVLAAGADTPAARFSVVVAGAVLSALTVRLARPVPPLAAAFGVTGAGLLVIITEPEWLWAALIVAAAGVWSTATRPRLRRPALVAGTVLLLGASWVRLGLAGVTAPEPYTLPAGLLLLALGFRRTGGSSWAAYGPGLALCLLPTLPGALGDDAARTGSLAAAAIVVLMAGASQRLQAPLLTGGGMLALIAVVQLAPQVAELYEAVPRWAVLAGAGLLLVAAGARFEHRMRDLKRLGRAVRSLK